MSVDALTSLLGLGEEARHLTILQVALRALVVFFAALVIVRVAHKRFFAKKTAFDLILGLILASMLARTINGSEPLVASIIAGFILAFLHRGMAALAFHWPRFGGWIKGHTATLIEDGRPLQSNLQQHHIGGDDLDEELRLNGLCSRDEVKLATLERSGEVSVVKKPS